MPSAPDSWPELRVAAWRDTYATLLLYSQVVGKIRLALAPKMNQWWNVTLYVTARGLTTSPMPYGDRLLSIDFDFIDHRVIIQASDGALRVVPLEAKPVCFFYADVMAALAAIGPPVQIWPQPQECPVTTPFTDDREHAHYDRAAVQQYWQALRRIEPVFQKFRSRFRGKCSPVHFFWGAFDLAVTRFVGRRAPAAQGEGRSRRLRRGGHLARLLARRSVDRRHRGAVLLVHRARTGRPRRRVRVARRRAVEPDAEGVRPPLRRRPPRRRSRRRNPRLRPEHLRGGRDARRLEPRSARVSVRQLLLGDLHAGGAEDLRRQPARADVVLAGGDQLAQRLDTRRRILTGSGLDGSA